MIVNVVVEGRSDSEAAKAVVRAAGHSIGKVVEKGGKTRLDPDIPKYNAAAMRSPWIVFRDSDGECPVLLRQSLLTGVATASPLFHLRIAHSMTEAWILADRAGFADFFQVSLARISRDPESLLHAKHELLRLCSNSRSRKIRTAMVAGDDEPGPLYVSTLNDFARNAWAVAEAATVSQSLSRAIDRIRLLDP